MPTQTTVQIAAAVATLVAIPLLYTGLIHHDSVLAAGAFILFALSLLASPAYKMLPSTDPA